MRLVRVVAGLSIATVHPGLVPSHSRSPIRVWRWWCHISGWALQSPVRGLRCAGRSWPDTIDAVGAGREARQRSGASLAAVACPSTTQCTSVDSNGRELTFNPAALAGPTSAIVDPIGQTGNTINGLACPSTTQCTAVDSRNVATFDRLAPTTASVSAIDPTSISEMNAVACPSTSQCTIVSGDGTQYTINPVAKTGSMSVIDLNRSLWGIAWSISQPGHGGSTSTARSLSTQARRERRRGSASTHPAQARINPSTRLCAHRRANARPWTTRALRCRATRRARTVGGRSTSRRERRSEPGRRVMRVGQCVRGARRRWRRLGRRPQGSATTTADSRENRRGKIGPRCGAPRSIRRAGEHRDDLGHPLRASSLRRDNPV